jgi:hypothetical protein
MLRDVFYYNTKPNVHPREQFAENLADARSKATTRDFWIINEFCNYQEFDWDFDFEFLPDEDVWAEDHNNVWPSQHQKDSGTWLCPKEYSDIIVYRCDVDPVIRKSIKTNNWVELDLVDHSKFDFSWHPDPSDPPFIYKWGCKYFPAQFKHVLEYHIEGATTVKYMNAVVDLLSESGRWEIPSYIDKDRFDFAWRPNPLDPALIYEFSTQWQKSGGPRYIAPGATDTKYINDQRAVALPDITHWTVPDNIDSNGFDFSWHPDSTSPDYNYVFATQWAFSGGPVYTMPNAVETKYIDVQIAIAKSDKTNWICDDTEIDVDSFDFSWHPYVEDQPYIYEFGTQWQKTGGPKYITPGADSSSPTKYIDSRILTSTRLQNSIDKNWNVLYDIEYFDFSWHPDNTEEPYIYVFGNQWYSAEVMPTIEYIMPGAKSIKYVPTVVAKLAANMDNWVIPDNIDVTEFNFNWRPEPGSPLYIYEFATQWQKTGGPQYVMHGATEKNYVDFQKVKKLTSMENWSIPDNVDISDFDFSWHPDATSPAYTYVFATQWAFSGGPIYTVNGSTETKYIDDQTAIAKPNKDNWVYDETEIDINSFDFSWHPHVEDQPYIYQFGTQHQKTGGPRYITLGADSSSPVKYVDTRIIKATRLPNKTNSCWNVKYDIADFDWSWHPDDTDTPYIYLFGNQWHAAEVMPTVEYTMAGATEIKYVHSSVATLAPVMENWKIPDYLDTSTFDFSFRPEPESPLYIYEFATQWQKTGGPQYVMHGATEVKYIDIQKAKRLPCIDNWEILESIDESKFDFSWHPDDTAPALIYAWGNQWNKSVDKVSVQYVVPGATMYQYMDENSIRQADKSNWIYDGAEIDAEAFDFSWQPQVEDQPYIYQFGTQWQKTGGPRYITLGANSSSPVKYIDTRIIKAKRLPNRSRFTVLGGAKVKDFDWSWHPDDSSPPYIYQFGNNWYPAEEMPTVEYRVEGATEAKFMTEILARLAPNMDNWTIPENVDVAKFDFSWIPHPTASPYIYQFGTSTDPSDGPVYISLGNDGETINVPRVEVDEVVIEEIETPVVATIEEDALPVEQLDMFFVDRGNIESAARFEALRAKFGTRIQKTRYLNSWVDTINRCTNRATSQLLWVLNSELDYTNFDFSYYPNVWQMKMVHVFGTQWSHWGTTFMVNRETFPHDTKYINIIEHLSNLNFIKTIRATATACVHDIIMIDHGNKEITSVIKQVEQTASRKVFSTIKYDDSYLNTIKNYVTKLPNRKEHYLWICSSVCDYSQFDFTYVCDPFAKDNLHVFPSGIQKFGDTFFIDVNKTKEIIDEIEKLEEYHTVNFNSTVKTSRLPEPIIVTRDDTHINAVPNVTGFPYATIITADNVDIEVVPVEPMNLWSADTKNILITSTGATRIIVPAEAAGIVKKELYDYPYIKRAPRLSKSSPMDIVFLSNGEAGADGNWEHLLSVTKGLPNRVVRVDGVHGRAAAYHAAAEASETPWMFTVFAKLKVSPKFDWNWQPDRMQVPKHYIFHAKNPVNGLIYGHQAMIAYNKKLTLANEGRGLDFTLDDEHEVVPLISGIAMYNTDPFSTWRTSFREVLKLKADDSEESRIRLDAWLNKAEGDFAQYSIKGAVDADEYFDEVPGDFDKLKLSYEWAWLREKFDQS